MLLQQMHVLRKSWLITFISLVRFEIMNTSLNFYETLIHLPVLAQHLQKGKEDLSFPTLNMYDQAKKLSVLGQTGVSKICRPKTRLLLKDS